MVLNISIQSLLDIGELLMGKFVRAFFFSAATCDHNVVIG